MKRIKKILKISGITLGILIIIAFLVPILFKKQITSLVKKEINKSLIATVDFKDVSLSLLRSFPKVSIIIKDLSIVGQNEFAGDTLLYTEKAAASANLWSVIKGSDIKVSALLLESPNVNLLVNKEGLANWDIAKASTDTSASTDAASAFQMSLKVYKIRNGQIVYNDESSSTYMNLKGVDHTGSGNLTEDVFTLSTSTDAASASFTQGTIPYLVNAKTTIETDIAIDNKTQTYTFNTDDIKLNNLKLSAEGFFQLMNDSTYKMDIKFQSPSNEFKDILSLVPAIYKNDFDQLKTSGSATFNGFVKGIYSPQQIPAYDIKAEVKDGSFQYPDLPKPVRNIQFALHASNPDGQPDNAVIDISKGHLEMGNEPFDFRFLFRNPETAQYIDAAAKGRLELAQLSQFIKLEEGTKLSGSINADAFAKGYMSGLQDQQGAFTAGGFFDVRNLNYAAKELPQPIRNGNMRIQLENTSGIADKTNVAISSGHIELGNDPMDFTLNLSNPVTTVNFNGTAKGRLTLDNLKPFLTLEPGSSLSGILNADIRFAGSQALINQGAYDKIEFGGTASLSNGKFVSPDYPTGVNISSLAASFTTSNANISHFNGQYLGSNFTGSGTLNNLAGFAMNSEPLRGVLNVSVDKMDLNAWTGTTDASPVSKTGAPPPPDPAPFLVPNNIDMLLNVKAGKVTYDKVDYNNLDGAVVMENETVKFRDVKAQALDGTAVINGSYSTKTNKSNPDMAITGTVKDVSIQKAFYAYNTIQSIMPIGKFLDGKLHSDISMTGSLNGDMMPNLNSLSGKGNLLLLEGVLKKFAPLEKIAERLQIDRLKAISVKDIRNYFEFSNGKVLVKPFNLKVEDIELQVGGMHGFDQSLDYIIAMKVPRRYLGTAGNNLVNGLVTSANGKGIPVKLGDVVNLNVKMGGTMTNPAIKIDLEQVVGNAVEDLKQQAEDFAKAKIDSAKQKVKDSLATIKNQVKDDLKDKLKEQFFGKDTLKKDTPPADTSKKKGGAVIKETLKDLLNRKKKPAADTLKKQ
jgi:hypothetical protein